MFAVIAQGGKQYRVQPGDVLRIERPSSIPENGGSLELTDVRVVGDGGDLKVGAPSVEGASVRATVIRQLRGRKIIVFKKKRRKGYKLRRGHRQNLLEIRIDEIAGA